MSQKPGRGHKRKRSAGGLKAGDAYQDAVAAVAKTLYPSAHIEVGQWIVGPDGERDLDVSVHPSRGAPPDVVIECKDWKRPIGIGMIDALESKRRDIGANVVMVCSNSGFTEDALRKASRVGIPALTALRRGDSRVRVSVEQLIYTRYVVFGPKRRVHVDHVPTRASDQLRQDEPFDLGRILCEGRPLAGWVARKFLDFVATHCTTSGPLEVKIRFREQVPMDMAGLAFEMLGLTLHGTVAVEWRTQTVRINASNGMYDFLRCALMLGAGEEFQVSNLDVVGWGRPVGREDVPPNLLVPLAHRKFEKGTFDLEILKASNVMSDEIRRAPNLDAFVESVTVLDATSGATGP